jgi:hypothetical protein
MTGNAASSSARSVRWPFAAKSRARDERAAGAGDEQAARARVRRDRPHGRREVVEDLRCERVHRALAVDRQQPDARLLLLQQHRFVGHRLASCE